MSNTALHRGACVLFLRVAGQEKPCGVRCGSRMGFPRPGNQGHGVARLATHVRISHMHGPWWGLLSGGLLRQPRAWV